jgi:hypothetical protein
MFDPAWEAIDVVVLKDENTFIDGIARNIQVNQFARYFKGEIGSLECYAQYE